MVRTTQRGSILGFVIVGGVLALLLVGGAYFVRHTLASTIKKETPVASQGNNSEPTQSSSGDSGTSKDKDNNQHTTEGTTLPGQTDTDSSSPQASPDSVAQNDLPQTGPADALLSGILLGGVVAASVAYKRSRNIATSL